MFKKKKNSEYEVIKNNSLINAITPVGFEFFRNHLFIGDNKAKIYGIVKYPSKVDYGFLSKLTNIQNTYVSICYTPIDSSEFIMALSNNITTQKTTAENAKEAIDRQRAEKSYKDSQKMMEQIDQDSIAVGKLSICIMPTADEEEKFEKTCKDLKTKLTTVSLSSRVLPALQKEGFKQISPFYSVSKDVLKITDKVVPLTSVIGGFPFSSNRLDDNDGYILAKDSDNSLIVFDLWKRTDDRTNSNIVIMGIAGQGKSTAIKHIIKQEWLNGTKIICIDPEAEYKTLTINLGGDIIDAGGISNKSNIINPFEIRPVPRDEDDEDNSYSENEKLYKDEGYGVGALALHLKTLDLFFSLYLNELNSLEKAMLKKCIIKLYNEFGIDFDTDTSVLDSEDFPIMKDLYILIENEKDIDQEIKNKLLSLLYNSVYGDDQFLFNGYSNFTSTSRITCIDTSMTQGFNENLKAVQYFNILTWAWREMSRDRTEKVMLICDEAYLMIDKNTPEALIYLRNIEKRSRKYESSIAVISHSVVDFLDESVKQYGQALLDIPTYKIIFGTDGKNILETKHLYDLKTPEEELLLSKKRGNALFICGSRRMKINFELTKDELALFGKAGGR
ncbi:VirB4 family type IV secretion system protein [Peptoanaerobacter stomatis]